MTEQNDQTDQTHRTATEPAESGEPIKGAEPADTTFTIQQFPEKIAVVRLPPGADIPDWAESSSIFSITATATETALVCAGRNVPVKVVAARGLIGFSLTQTLAPTSVGVVVALLTPLAEEEISVFTFTTYDTTWVLIPVADSERAADAWRRQGHTVDLAVPVKPESSQKSHPQPDRPRKK